MNNLSKQQIKDFITVDDLVSILNAYPATSVYTMEDFFNNETNAQGKLDLLSHATTVDFTDKYLLTIVYDSAFGTSYKTFSTVNLVESLDLSTLNRAIQSYYANLSPLPALANALGLQHDSLQDVVDLIQYRENVLRDYHDKTELLSNVDIEDLYSYLIARKMVKDFASLYQYGARLDDIKVLDKDRLVEIALDYTIQLYYQNAPASKEDWYNIIKKYIA